MPSREEANEKKFTFAGEVNGHKFTQVISLPLDSGGGLSGGGDGARKGPIVVFFGPVVFIEDQRAAAGA